MAELIIDASDSQGLLIELIQTYEFLFDLANPDYKNIKKKNEAWQEISEVMNLDVSECQKIWKNLRDRFTRENRKLPSGSEASASIWPYYSRMQFYKRCSKPRKTHTATVIADDEASCSSRPGSSSSSRPLSAIDVLHSPSSPIAIDREEDEISDSLLSNEAPEISTPEHSHQRAFNLQATPARGSKKRKRSSETEIRALVEVAGEIASKIRGTDEVDSNQNCTQYILSRLREMTPERARRKRKKLLVEIEDSD